VRTLIALLLLASTASADAPYKIVEDSSLGIALPSDKRLLDDAKAAPAIAKCLATTPPSGSAVYWAQLNAKGKVTVTRVHGAGKPALDACLATALRKLAPTTKLTAPIAVVGRIDLADPAAPGTFLESPRVSSAAVMIAPHGARWQLTVDRIGYTMNRAQDIAAALDVRSAAVAACAAKRGAKAQPAEALAWVAGKKAAFQSGHPAYDACVAKALGAVALPTAESALWMHVTILAPAEPLAPRTTKAGLSKEDALRDALTTAVRSRKAELLTCLDLDAKAKLLAVRVALRDGKMNVIKVSTGSVRVDACVRGKLRDIAIPNAATGDKLDLAVTLDPVTE
jgi:hypothetical protein